MSIGDGVSVELVAIHPFAAITDSVAMLLDPPSKNVARVVLVAGHAAETLPATLPDVKVLIDFGMRTFERRKQVTCNH